MNLDVIFWSSATLDSSDTSPFWFQIFFTSYLSHVFLLQLSTMNCSEGNAVLPPIELGQLFPEEHIGRCSWIALVFYLLHLKLSARFRQWICQKAALGLLKLIAQQFQEEIKGASNWTASILLSLKFKIIFIYYFPRQFHWRFRQWIDVKAKLDLQIPFALLFSKDFTDFPIGQLQL